MIALITPTGARPDQIRTCAELMRKQTFDGRVIWVIVDDAFPTTIDFIPRDFRSFWDIVKLYPQPHWIPGQNTQGRNIRVALDFIMKNYDSQSIDGVFVIEDDDWYSVEYLEKMIKHLDGFQAGGETHTIYYNLAISQWVMNQNDVWSSLFQTAMTMDVLPVFRTFLAEKFIDYAFFHAFDGRTNLFRDGNLAVGMKGQPGRAGIGAGHGRQRCMVDDADHRKLRQLIGIDIGLYFNE